MISFQNLPYLQIFSGLEISLKEEKIYSSKKNLSVYFDLSFNKVSGHLILDAHELGHTGRMEILEAFTETMNIYLGKILSLEESKELISPPRLLNIDLNLSFEKGNWSFFEFLFNDSIFPVAIAIEQKH